MTGTLSPAPWFTGLDSNGNPLPGALLFTYDTGTTTKRATYTDAELTVAHANPIVLDAAGRAVIYLSPTAYKFVLAPSNDTDPPTSPIKTVDPVGAVPTTNVDLDVQGVAGETIPAPRAVYLSDGTGGLTAGRWYLANATNPYSSSEAKVLGAVQTAIASGATGSIRLQGRVTGLSALTAGTVYYVSTSAGLQTATAPGNVRVIGVADTTTSMIIGEKRELDVRLVATFETTVGNVGAGEDTLAEYIAPASEIAGDDYSYRGEFWGQTTNNANAKTLRVRVIEGANNTVLIALALTANEAGHWTLAFRVMQATATTTRAWARCEVGPADGPVSRQGTRASQPNATLANAVTIRLTGEATTDNDITMEGGIITLTPKFAQ